MEEYEALVNCTDRKIQKQSVRGRGATVGAMERTRDKRDCRRSATVPQGLFKHRFTKKYGGEGGRVDTSVYS